MWKFLSILFAVCICSLVHSQDLTATLSVQQGHAAEIDWIDASKDGRFLASAGRDNKIVVWDLLSGSQLSFHYAPNKVNAIQFSETTAELIYTCNSKSYRYNFSTGTHSTDSQKNAPGKPRLYAAVAGNYVECEDSKITLYTSSKVKIKRRTSTYFDQGFTSVVYSDKQKHIYAACQDGLVYVYDQELNFLHFLKGHLNNINDLCLSADEKYLFSGSSDRSIIQWDLETQSIQRRFSGRSYATYALSLNNGNQSVRFADETGFLKEIQLESSSLEISSTRKSIYPITFSAQLDSNEYLYAGNDNKLIRVKNDRETALTRIVRITPKQVAHQVVTKLLGLYKKPYTTYYDIELNPASDKLAHVSYAAGYYLPYYRLIDLQTGKKSRKLYTYGHTQMNDPIFLNDSVFFTLDFTEQIDAWSENDTLSPNAILLWKAENGNVRKISNKTIPLGRQVVFAERLTSTQILLIDTEYKILLFDLATSIATAQPYENINYIFGLTENMAALRTQNNDLRIVELKNGKLIEKCFLSGHQDLITSCEIDLQRNRLFSSSKDATIRIWDLLAGQLLVTVIPIGAQEAIYITPDNYYMTTSKDLNSFGFKVGDNYYFPEQFDPVFNRPDLVLGRLGYVDTSLVSAYHQAYLKRIEKLGYSEEMLKPDFHLPTLNLVNKQSLPLETGENQLVVNLSLSDAKYTLDRIMVWVNDVAVYGTRGINLRHGNYYQLDTSVIVPLALGENKVQVSVMNNAGAESFKTTFKLNSSSGKTQPDLYLVTIGCSNFQDKTYNLNYAAKDAKDIAAAFGQNKIYNQVHTVQLLDEQVTLDNVKNTKSFLEKADINDEVILFFAGHGVLDDELDYYLASYDMNFSKPSEKGIPYGVLEWLVDGIKPLRKLIFIDACHSGELDKDEIESTQNNNEENDEDLTFRHVGNAVSQKETQLGVQSTSQLTKSLFADLRKGTGATVISSAGGLEFAIESNTWQNGLFTYCLLQGIQTKKADLDRNGEIMLNELQQYISEQVVLLSKGRQQPTSRIENNALDYRVW